MAAARLAGLEKPAADEAAASTAAKASAPSAPSKQMIFNVEDETASADRRLQLEQQIAFVKAQSVS